MVARCVGSLFPGGGRIAMIYLVLKYLHVLGAIVLLGTGVGIAFFMLMAHRSGDAGHIFRTAKTVVIADFIFTATAVAAQPVTGILLTRELGLPLSEGWLLVSLVLYVVAGMFWLPVVWMQMRMRDLAWKALSHGGPLPAEYQRLFRVWFLFGFPGFGAVIAILWLMISKPSF
ncbi:DUF2269 domain-containing protein [Microbacteriaceae bacterium K1510]|nr:DUF2269 domain-containing protein [Microbacteriaceae bacterium K1510]